MMNRCGLVLLAAGSSTRFGSPKQLLDYKGKSMVVRSIEAALGSGAYPIMVVLGDHAPALVSELKQLPVRTVFNPDFREGMGSSISCGMSALDERGLDGVIFIVCDQPFISSDVIGTLMSKASTRRRCIVACSYADIIGIPVLFTKDYFPELKRLKGQEGAKKMFSKYAEDLITVPFPEGEIDIDTIDDYRKLLAR